MRGPNKLAIDRERTSDVANIAIFSDLYPHTLGSYETVFRYNTLQEAEADYSYSKKMNGDGYFPVGWKFSSETAGESFISCVNDFYLDFPLCYWVARYDCIVVEFGSWLIPERITMDDMETIVREIDQKASEFIPDNY